MDPFDFAIQNHQKVSKKLEEKKLKEALEKVEEEKEKETENPSKESNLSLSYEFSTNFFSIHRILLDLLHQRRNLAHLREEELELLKELGITKGDINNRNKVQNLATYIEGIIQSNINEKIYRFYCENTA